LTQVSGIYESLRKKLKEKVDATLGRLQAIILSYTLASPVPFADRMGDPKEKAGTPMGIPASSNYTAPTGDADRVTAMGQF
jgi:hypothetical protein